MLRLRIYLPFSPGPREARGVTGVRRLKSERSLSAADPLIWNPAESCLRRNFFERVSSIELSQDLSLPRGLSLNVVHRLDGCSNKEHFSAGESGSPCVVIGRNGRPPVAGRNLYRHHGIRTSFAGSKAFWRSNLN